MASFIKIPAPNDDTVLVNLDSVRYCRSSQKTPDKTTFMFDENQRSSPQSPTRKKEPLRPAVCVR